MIVSLSAIEHPSLVPGPTSNALKWAGSSCCPTLPHPPSVPHPPLPSRPHTLSLPKVPFLISALVPISCIAVVLGKRYLNASRELKRLDSVSKSPIYAHFSESVNGVSTM